MLAPWKKSYDKPRMHIKKQRHYFVDKGLYSQSYGFSSSHMWLSWSRIHLHCGRPGFDHRVGKIPWRRKGYPLQYSGLEKSMDCIVKGVAKSQTQWATFTFTLYGCESWTIKKAENQRIDAFKLWCWRRPLRLPWTTRRSNQSILKEINPEYSLEGLMLNLKLQYLGCYCCCC